MADGKGILVWAMLTAGQVSGMKICPELVKGVGGVRIVADKGCDNKATGEAVCRSGSFSCIPRRAGGVEAVPFHKGYIRHHVENFFQRIKRQRRIATRYDKLANVFLSFIHLAAPLDWINSFRGTQTRNSSAKGSGQA